MTTDSIFTKFDLRGRTAIVTGGPGLLGKEFCRTLAEAGAGVVVADLNGQAAQHVLPPRLAWELHRPGWRAASCRPGWPCCWEA